MTRVVIDPDKCQGHGLCYINHPGLFGDDDQAFGTVLVVGELDAAQLAVARDGVDACPERAISLTD